MIAKKSRMKQYKNEKSKHVIPMDWNNDQNKYNKGFMVKIVTISIAATIILLSIGIWL